jgi:hypothetical protein
MSNCPSCDSLDVVKKGREFRFNKISQRFHCKSCDMNFYDDSIPKDVEQPQIALKSLVIDGKEKSYVITCAVNDVPVNEKFLATLLSYCKFNDAELLIVPVKYQQGLGEGYNWPSSIEPYFIKENVKLTNGLKLLAGINVSPAIGNPLTGFEMLSQGDSIIIPHSQMMMKSIAMSGSDPSAIITTTGAITEPIYTPTKQGEKASYNHSYSALIVEEDKSIDGFHFRVLNSSEDGSFYDLSEFYDGSVIKFDQTVEAIVLGDAHIRWADPKVTAATFTNEDSIVNVLKPKYLIRHDVFDGQSLSHHHDKNIFIKYAKHCVEKDDVAGELAETIEYILNTTPNFAKSIIVASNHDSHLLKWLNESNPKLDNRNALLYYELMYLMLKETKMNGSMLSCPNPLALWAEHNYNIENIQFLGLQQSYKLHNIEMSYHGDKCVNGSRGNAMGFSKLGNKSIVGHAHSPQIFGGCYTVGTSSLLQMDYNVGPSGWAHTHCIVHLNGKRQMCFIINGKYRRN